MLVKDGVWYFIKDKLRTMVYMHKETFVITQRLGNGTNNPQDFFEIDYLIASTVQVLSRKRYSTVDCCSGHAFVWLI